MAEGSTGLEKVVDLYVLGRVARGEIARRTARNDRWVLLAFASTVRTVPVSELSTAHVQVWLDSKAVLKHATRREHLRVVRQFFDHLVEAGGIARNPTGGIRLAPPVTAPALRRYGPVPRCVDDVQLEYLQHLERRGLRSATIDLRRRQVSRLAAALGDTALLDATPRDLVEYLDRLRGHSAEYRHAEVCAVRGFYRWAVVEEYIGRDPTVRLPLPKRRRGLPHPMPDDDVARALEAATDTPVRQWLHLAAFGGLRAGEIAQVRRDELIGGAARDTKVLLVTNGKGGHSRTVPLGDEVVTMLNDPELPAAGYLFPRVSDPRQPIAAGQVSHRTNTFLHELGIPHTLHSLRHFYGTKLYTMTRDIRLVQEVLGHGSPVVTSLYTKITLDEHADTIRSFPRVWRAELQS